MLPGSILSFVQICISFLNISHAIKYPSGKWLKQVKDWILCCLCIHLLSLSRAFLKTWIEAILEFGPDEGLDFNPRLPYWTPISGLRLPQHPSSKCSGLIFQAQFQACNNVNFIILGVIWRDHSSKYSQRDTVLVIIKLTKFAVALRLRCGSFKLIFWHYILLHLRTLYIVWSLVRRRVTRRLTRLQTMCNVLKYRKMLENVALRLRCGCDAVAFIIFNLLKTSTVVVTNIFFFFSQWITSIFGQLYKCFDIMQYIFWSWPWPNVVKNWSNVPKSRLWWHCTFLPIRNLNYIFYVMPYQCLVFRNHEM